MEPSGRLQVLGENEALQQFFNGQDVSGVLESSVAVDTSILEQYLSNNMDPNSFMLPESPPDSNSEACSPPQITDFHYEAPHWSNQLANQEVFNPATQSAASPSCRFKSRGPAPPELLTHAHLRTLGLTNTRPISHTQCSPEHTHYTQVYTPPTPPVQEPLPPSPPPLLPPTHNFPGICGSPERVPGLVQAPPPPAHLLAPTPALHAGSSCQPDNKKRRRSGSEEAPGGADVSCCDGDGAHGGGGASLGPYQLLTWESYRPREWSSLYDSSLQALPPPAYHVVTDKGFNYSTADEAFVCQKKNHFQVTVHIGVAGEPHYVRTPSGPQEVEHFLVKVFGVKLEAPGHQVTIEQSQSDRSKKPFLPIRVSLPGDRITKVTLGRLHFSETTANNMRKKGKPNPDQRYFLMVVGLYASVGPDSLLVSALLSERIIVRASNPGQFEMDGDTLWQRGAAQDTAVCQGRVGINTDAPDEALVVCGNAKVMGAVMQPSDHRAKQNVQQVDSEDQLRRITQMRIVEFDYKPEFASSMGINHTHQTGIIAQEVRELLPSAVTEVGDVMCADGEKIHNFLMVDKEQIFMENVGAVQQLCKLTDNLDTRIQELEGWSHRLAKLKSLTGSLRSTRKLSKNSSVLTPHKTNTLQTVKQDSWSQKCLQHKVFQASVFTLLATMAFCVISITALYLLTLREDSINIFPGNSNGSVFPVQTTAWSSTESPPTPSALPGPPEVDFCELLYCEQVYCCPSTAGGSTHCNNTGTPGTEQDSALADKGKEKLCDKLKRASDWTNTTIQTFLIKESQQVIDSRYCNSNTCGSGRFSFSVPISRFVPVNMRVTLLMNATELLVVHLCSFDESTPCSALLEMDSVAESRYPSNTQGEHEWQLHVARLHHSSYHFRSAVAGQADCSTDHHYAGALFTDYHFHFYRRCSD
ncbi:myelin regulatory factor-like protein [Myripristis murdjan]|uniref:myelin regulatory factor-like protein n=1 Tax=Myripristis murdjan TaxID=586833 RepID=UPI001175EE67|nr:myelin regulatory factor-like protein [Myripristis murdjan]